MLIIPVIDIRHGFAVHAVKGERARYKPLESLLAKSADPVDVALGFRELHPFVTLYVADLDGIEGRGAESELQRRIIAAWPGTSVWVDDGAHEPSTKDWPGGPGKRVTVIGSETLPPRLPRPRAAGRKSSEGAGQAGAGGWHPEWDPARWVLSLDFHDDELLGPEWLLEEPALWPERVIAMTVRRVGTGGGADLATVARIAKIADGKRQVFAAGGVRDARDLAALHEAGANGALVATALHAGTIKAGELDRLAGL